MAEPPVIVNFAVLFRMMKELVPAVLYEKHPLCKQLLDVLSQWHEGAIQIEGLTGSSLSIVLSSLFKKHPSCLLVILPDKDDAAYFYNDVMSLAGEDSALFFPSSYKRSARYSNTDPAAIVLRTAVLNHLSADAGKRIIVTSPEGVMEKVISRHNLRKNTLVIKKGSDLPPSFVEEMLIEYGFRRADFVYEPGQYAMRGSITDLFSFATDKPFRIDYFGNTVESIRVFNPDSQLSEEVVDEIAVVPNIQDFPSEEVSDSLLDFLSDDTIIAISSPSLIRDTINEIYTLSPGDDTNNRQSTLLSGDMLLGKIGKFRQLYVGRQHETDCKDSIVFNTEPQPAFNKNFGLLGDRLRLNSETGYINIIVSENEAQIERLKDIFAEINPPAFFIPLLSNLHGGFTDHDLKISIFTDHQIFDRYHRYRIKGYFTRKESISFRELTGLNPGDYVVHTDHGIGRFGGLEKIEINGKLQEAIKIVYRDNDILFVNISSLNRISKYKGKDAAEPKIHKLGSGAWQKLKQETKKKVKDIARDLIRIYAQRMTVPGFAFSPDSYLQRELEASFLYEDTPDQGSATVAVKHDMEARYPMDRLICGDVGFGKTEIAVRAAFKAAVDGKQTALLVPTTILALQHYKTFRARLGDFPCRVDYLSRHRKAADQKKILASLADGSTDIIIATHRLVSNDVVFKNLGMLIIDEEQRFGVAVKEKIKKMKVNVDTLTLSATPIPRTLQFSLMGARDMSVINTPPPNRVPIATELHGFNEDIIREGIEYEVGRNGQVFFIHNRVDTIREMQISIERICREVRTAVVHGKMPGSRIEDIMSGFIQGDYDVLIATTIIESGLDIPNANTIFINNAHQFGLSELHQLRGRVGRSNRRAFCYMLTPPLSSLSQDARRRVMAVEEFSGLSSGFNIALQDLDIRGAGNLLGSEQSGFIADIGFEAYQQILSEAAIELRDEIEDTGAEGTTAGQEGIPDIEDKPHYHTGIPAFTPVSDILIDTDMEIMYPDDYISNIPERIRLYRELNELYNEDALAKYEMRLTDRFGPVPPQAAALLDIVRMKWTAARLGMKKINLGKGLMIISFDPNPQSPFYRSGKFIALMNYVNRRQNLMKMKQSQERLTLTVSNINSVASARKLLAEMDDNTG